MARDWSTKPWNTDLPPESCVKMPNYSVKNRHVPHVAPLLVCNSCNVCVHNTCYSSSPPTSDWLCDKCKDQQYFARCCLCPIRGGALRKTTSNSWVHVVCAVFMPEAKFINLKNGSDIVELPKYDSYNWCTVCRKPQVYMKCCDTSCNTCWYHVTCATFCGVKIELNLHRAGSRFLITCSHHTNHHHEKMCGVQVGQWVWGRSQNNRYYRGRVLNISRITFYTVAFPDGSFTDRLPPSNIIKSYGEEDLQPEVGDQIRARWNDQQYHAVYHGSDTKIIYRVCFETGNLVLDIDYGDIYCLDEELGKNLRKRLLRGNQSSKMKDITVTRRNKLPQAVIDLNYT